MKKNRKRFTRRVACFFGLHEWEGLSMRKELLTVQRTFEPSLFSVAYLNAPRTVDLGVHQYIRRVDTEVCYFCDRQREVYTNEGRPTLQQRRQFREG